VNDYTEDLVVLASDLVVGEEFALTYSGCASIEEALGFFWESGRHQSVVVTRGAEGAEVVSADGRWRQEAFRLPVVDTTGCGDVFHGAYALGRARGLPLRDIVLYATAVAGLKVRRLGGRAGIPTDEEVRRFLAEGT
jgi:sugar/nucleoside kinase (ribokinase family)